MFLLKIGIFEINISSIISLILGIALGLAIFVLIYLIFILKELNKNNITLDIHPINLEIISDLSKKEKKDLLLENDLNNKAIIVNDMIINYEKMFLDNKLRGKLSYYNHAYSLVKSLVTNIASVYYPDSKRPYSEITIEEALLLIKYISNRIDEFLNFNGLKFIRGISLKTIVNFKYFYKLFDDWFIVKICKKYKINKVLNGLKVVINVVNPFYWVRKIIIDSSIRVISKRLCLNIIGIVGEEAYNIYSKSVFKMEVNV